MKIILFLFRYVVIAMLAGFIATYGIQFFSDILHFFYPSESSGWTSLTSVAVLVYAYALLFPALTITFGDSSRYIITGIFLAVVGLIELVTDTSHILFWPFVLVSGVALGWALRFIISNTIGNMPTFQAWKKYF